MSKRTEKGWNITEIIKTIVCGVNREVITATSKLESVRDRKAKERG